MKIMESSSLNEEELLWAQLDMASADYNKFRNDEYKKQVLLQFLQDNDCRKAISKCKDGDNFAVSFTRGCLRNHIDILQAFLDHGIKVDVKDDDCDTALMCASNQGYKEIVQLLLEHNADIDLKDNFGQTALELASTEEIEEMIQNHVNTSYVLK